MTLLLGFKHVEILFHLGYPSESSTIKANLAIQVLSLHSVVLLLPSAEKQAYRESVTYLAVHSTSLPKQLPSLPRRLLRRNRGYRTSPLRLRVAFDGLHIALEVVLVRPLEDVRLSLCINAISQNSDGSDLWPTKLVQPVLPPEHPLSSLLLGQAARLVLVILVVRVKVESSALGTILPLSDLARLSFSTCIVSCCHLPVIMSDRLSS